MRPPTVKVLPRTAAREVFNAYTPMSLAERSASRTMTVRVFCPSRRDSTARWKPEKEDRVTEAEGQGSVCESQYCVTLKEAL